MSQNKATEYFKRTIQQYLEQRAQEDELFRPRYANPQKNIDDCITFILNYVQKSGCNGFTDDEIYSLALHYYDEDDLDIGKPIQCNVVVNHTIELTDEEKRAFLGGNAKAFYGFGPLPHLEYIKNMSE